jgi:hypothetical protein
LLAARYRVEVKDRDGKLVTVLEGDSKSFTQNFIKLLIASHYNQNDVPTFSVYDVFGDSFYTGYTRTPYAGVPWQIFNLDPDQWASSTLFVPAIWLGTSPCANPALANGPCGSLAACCSTGNFPFSPYNVGPSALCYGLASCSPSLTEEGWAITITNQWLNMSGSPVTIASMALVFAVPVTSSGSPDFSPVMSSHNLLYLNMVLLAHSLLLLYLRPTPLSLITFPLPLPSGQDTL